MPPLTSPTRTGATAVGALALLAALTTGPAHAEHRADPQVTQDSLTPTSALPNTPVTGQLKVHSSACFTVQTLGIAVRDSNGKNLDFPGSLSNTQICPTGVTLTTGAESFPAGTYQVFGFFQDQAGAWTNLPTQQLVVANPTPVVTQDSLTPATATANTPVSAQLKVHSNVCFTAQAIGVAVRDSQGNNLDFPGSLGSTQICPTGFTLTTGSESFPAGTYQVFGYYESQSGTWTNLPTQQLVVTNPTPVVTQDSLTPTTATANTPVTAQLTVHSNVCFTAQAIGVAVRDRQGNNLDFPGSLGSTQICPTGFTLTTGSESFPAGTYQVFGYYETQSGTWTNLPTQQLVVSAAQTTPSSPIAGQSLVWSDEFNGPLDTTKWNNANSSAYAYNTSNPKDDKLDLINPLNVTVANGVATFTAKPTVSVALPAPFQNLTPWETGLLTTENTSGKFMVKTGDYAEARVQLPSQLGAWPAFWTWQSAGSPPGEGEIDSFEYHPDNANLLELTNHVDFAQKFWENVPNVQPGQWVTIGTHYGANSVTWYVNGTPVFSDTTGVGANWSAYLVLNLSICSGDYHPAPEGNTPITFAADYVHVFR
ncbi:glycoside hydrolase family 16 protein [Kitasatospora sp. LaBMicrA B282]|uniref:glycoside hydrolase family 16 protein n=1 Tax=Kitasatospora sp. LaBMicrA B282 TaxID=3420949 RepID=UPI003D0B40F2